MVGCRRLELRKLLLKRQVLDQFSFQPLVPRERIERSGMASRPGQLYRLVGLPLSRTRRRVVSVAGSAPAASRSRPGRSSQLSFTLAVSHPRVELGLPPRQVPCRLACG